MNKDVREKWIAWLEDSKNVQGHGWLGINEKRCCLGGLCDIAVEEGIIDPPNTHGNTVHYGEQVTYLPHLVADWAGLDRYPESSEEHDKLGEATIQDKLVEMNDADLFTFKEIADWIRENL